MCKCSIQYDNSIIATIKVFCQFARWYFLSLPEFQCGVCVCVFFPFILDIKFVGRTSRGHSGGRSHRIFHPPPFCGACLNFSREKDSSAVPFPRRPWSRILCTNELIVLHSLGIFSFVFSFLVRKIPFAGVELTSQRVRGLRGTSELPGDRRPCICYIYIHVCTAITYSRLSQSCSWPNGQGKWIFPCDRSRLRICCCETDSAVPSPASPIILHTQWIWRLITYGVVGLCSMRWPVQYARACTVRVLINGGNGLQCCTEAERGRILACKTPPLGQNDTSCCQQRAWPYR